MLLDNEVEKILVINEKTVEVYIKKEALATDEYKAVSNNKKGPHYTFTVGSIDYFQKQLEEA